MPRNRAKVEFGLLYCENRSSAIIRRDIRFWGEAASFEILRAWIRSARRLWAWTTLDIDEDIMHPVERLPLSQTLGGAEITKAKGKFVATRAQLMLVPSSPIQSSRLFHWQVRETLSRIDGDAIALFLSLSLPDGESDAPHAVVSSEISLTARQPISVVNRHRRFWMR